MGVCVCAADTVRGGGGGAGAVEYPEPGHTEGSRGLGDLGFRV